MYASVIKVLVTVCQLETQLSVCCVVKAGSLQTMFVFY